MNKKTLGLVALATLLGLAVRLFRLDYPALWLDEYSTYFYTLEPWSRLAGDLKAVDVHPPYYYMLQKLWGGDSVFTMRLLPVLLGTTCIPLVFLLARRLLSERAGVIAAFILTTAPLHVYYSRELRMYSLLNLSIIVGAVGLAYALPIKDKGRPWGWALYVLGAVSAFYAQASALLFPALCFALVVALTYLKHAERRHLVQSVAANGIVLLAIVPWFAILFGHVSGTLAHSWIHAPTVSWAMSQILGMYPYPKLIKVAIFAIMLLGLWQLRHRIPALSFITTFIAGQPALMWALSYIRPIMIVRAMAWPTMIATLLPAAVFAQWKRTAMVAATTLFVVAQVPAIAEFYPSQRAEYGAADLVTHMQSIPSSDLILFEHETFENDFRYQAPQVFDGGNVIAMTAGDVPGILEPLMRARRVNRRDLETEVAGKRVWVVSELQPRFANDVKPVLDHLLASHKHLQEYAHGGFALTVLDAGPTGAQVAEWKPHATRTGSAGTPTTRARRRSRNLIAGTSRRRRSSDSGTKVRS